MSIVSKVLVENFRNHKEFDFDADLVTVITGRNGVGKTSLLEALYLCLQGKSFKGNDEEILRRGEEYYRVEMKCVAGDGVVVGVVDGRRQFLVGDRKFLRLPKKNKYPVELFEPDDLQLINGSPSRRRRYFDKLISQLDIGYGTAVRRYEKSLRQRNEILKTGCSSGDVLVWDMMLAKLGVEIGRARSVWVGKINRRLVDAYRDIASNLDEVELIYKTGVPEVEQRYLEVLNLGFSRDIVIGSTYFGVHKDDFGFMFNNEEALHRASRGEVRSMILALKFVEAELLYDALGKKPIVMLDDVFSELDEVRQKCLLKNFKDNQIFITSVGLPRGMKAGVEL